MDYERTERSSSPSRARNQPFFTPANQSFSQANAQGNEGSFFQPQTNNGLVQREVNGPCQANCHDTPERSPFDSTFALEPSTERDEGFQHYVEQNEATQVGRRLSQNDYAEEHTIRIRYNIGEAHGNFSHIPVSFDPIMKH